MRQLYLLVLGINQNFIVDHWFCKTDGPSTNSRLVVNISFSKYLFIAADKIGYLHNVFSYFPMKIYVVGSFHSICFHEEIRKKILVIFFLLKKCLIWSYAYFRLCFFHISSGVIFAYHKSKVTQVDSLVFPVLQLASYNKK